MVGLYIITLLTLGVCGLVIGFTALAYVDQPRKVAVVGLSYMFFLILLIITVFVTVRC